MYAYKADLWCDTCGNRIKEELDAKDVADDGDSDTYPQYSDEDQSETDSPSHCAEGENCEGAVTLSDGRKVGALIMESLTDDGVAYVREAIAEAKQQKTQGEKHASVALEVWEPEYSQFYDLRDEDDSDGGSEEDEDEEPSEESLEEAEQAERVLAWFGMSDASNIKYLGKGQGSDRWKNELTGVVVCIAPDGTMYEE